MPLLYILFSAIVGWAFAYYIPVAFAFPLLVLCTGWVMICAYFDRRNLATTIAVLMCIPPFFAAWVTLVVIYGVSVTHIWAHVKPILESLPFGNLLKG